VIVVAGGVRAWTVARRPLNATKEAHHGDEEPVDGTDDGRDHQDDRNHQDDRDRQLALGVADHGDGLRAGAGDHRGCDERAGRGSGAPP